MHRFALDEAARALLVVALENGSLLLFERVDARAAPTLPGDAEAGRQGAPSGGQAARKDQPPAETTWIELRLVDADDLPVAGARYRIVLPNNETREGKLGADGTVRLAGIEAGSCDLSFPEIDAAEWGPV
ncbi:MAG: hypothetical protein WKG00_23285 [Polyangiaceae bacterium]